MDEVVDGIVVGVGINLTSVGAELIPGHVAGNALHSVPAIYGYATGALPIGSCLEDAVTCSSGFSFAVWIKLDTPPTGHYTDVIVFGKTYVTMDPNTNKVYLGVLAATQRIFIQYPYELGVWFHFGWTYKGDWSTAYKDGCPVTTTTWQNVAQNWGPYPGIHYGRDFAGGSTSAPICDVSFDESYIWEEEKPDIVFTLLYYGWGLY